MDGIRKAGSGIRSFDDAYSARIANMYQGSNPAVQAAGYLVGGAHPSFRKAQPDYRDGASKLEQALGNASEYAIPAANAVSKYVLPAAGVTLAGQGLIDLTAQFGGTADEQQPQELRL